MPPFLSGYTESFIDKNDEEKERIKIHQKTHNDAIREFWNLMQGADGILVLNFDRNAVKKYIGGNTLMEIGFSRVLNQKFFCGIRFPKFHFINQRSKLWGQ